MNTTTSQTTLPTFSNNYKNDKLTASQWIQEVIKQKAKASWTEAQTLTYIQKAFKGELIDWFYSLSILEVDTTNWNSVRESFENDSKVKRLTVPSMGQLPEITPKPTTSTPTTSSQVNQIEETEFTTVRNSRKKQTCKYCEKQGHSISNCWTLKSKNNARAEYLKQQKSNKQIKHNNKIPNKYKHLEAIQKLNHHDDYICPITTSKNW